MAINNTRYIYELIRKSINESKYKNDYQKESPLSANPFKPSSFEDVKSPETSYRNPTNIPISSPEENKESLRNKDGTISFSGSSVSNKVAHSEQVHPHTEPVSDPYAPHFSSDTQKRESIKSFDEKIRNTIKYKRFLLNKTWSDSKIQRAKQTKPRLLLLDLIVQYIYFIQKTKPKGP